MAKKKTTKFQTYPQTYQFGGLPFLDQYQKLGNQWDTFWRGGNYFSPGNVPPTGVYADPNAMLYNTVSNNNAAINAYNTNKQTLKDNSYTGEWGDDAHNYYYNKTLNNQYTPSQLDAFSAFEKKGFKANTDNSSYNTWYNGRENYANQAGAQFDSERLKRNNALAEQPGVNKQMGDAFKNTTAGIFSGLNYINAYKPPEEITTVKGTKGVMYSQKGGVVEPFKAYGLTDSPMMRRNGALPPEPGSNFARWENPRQAYTAVNELLFSGGSKIYKPNMKVSDALKKYTGGDYGNKVLGGKKLKDLTQLERDSLTQFIMQKENAASQHAMFDPIYNPDKAAGPSLMNYQVTSRADGGNINMEGYTPGTPSMENPINEIPSGNITMEETPIPLLAIGKKGADNGLIKILEPNSKGYNFKSKSTVEIPLEQQSKEQQMTPIAKYGRPLPYAQSGLNIASMLSGAAGQVSNAQAAYLNTLSGGEYINATPEFNQRMLQGYNQQQVPQVVPQTGMMVPNNGLFPQQAAYTQALPGDLTGYNPNDFKIKKGGTQKVAEYQKMLKEAGYNIEIDGAWGPKTKAAYEDFIGKKAPSKKAVQTGKAKVASNIAKTNIDTTVGESLLNYQVTDNTNRSNFQYPFVGNLNSAEQISTSSAQTSNPYGFTPAPGYVPLSTNSYRTSPQDEQVMRDGLYGLAGFAGGNLAGSLAIKGITSLPKVGKVVQYGSKYIDKAGNYVSKAGNKLGKAPKSVLEKMNKFFENDWIEQSKNNINYFNPLKPAEAVIGTPRFANPANIAPGVRNAWSPVPKQYGGYIPSFQFGGSVNDEHSTPIFSSNLEDFGLTELQTEKGEIAFMPDGSIVDVKAKELHKKQDKHNVSDIMQSGTYVFSNDPKMKFGIKSKIGGVELGDMKLGKSVFKYKENEISPGPEDIMLKTMFFNNNKKELTTADIAKNVKKNLPIVDLKNDYFADRAIAENKDQRLEYLSILKAFNEFKKPKQRSIPKAQYGMPIQPTQNGLDGVMGYGDKQMDPFKKMDNNMLSMFNYKQPPLPALPKIYEDGGAVEQAQLGKLLRYTVPGAYFVSEWIGNNKKKKQERENARLSAEAQGYRDQLQQGVDRSGALGVGTNIASYAAALNVPLQRYDDQSEQMSLYNAAANRAAQRLEASKYTASQGIGGASSLARYSNPTNYGDFLAKTQAQSDSSIGRINQAIADLDMQRANANVGFISARNAGRNQSLNSRDTQVYNANVQGIGNVGRSAQEATFNSADTRYRMGNEKMAYDAYLKDKAQAAKDKVTQDWEGSLDTLGQIGLTAATGGFGNLGGGGNKGGQAGGGFNPGAFNWQNPNQQFQQSPNNGLFQNTYPNFPTYSTMIPGGTVNRGPLTWDPVTGTWRY